MFCSNCGKEIEDNSKYCNYCGNKQKNNKIKINKKKIIIGLFVMTLIVFGITSALKLKNMSEDKTLSNNQENIEVVITWKEDARKDEIVSLMKYLRPYNDKSDKENSFEVWLEKINNLSENNLFAKKIIEKINYKEYMNLYDYEKNFIDFYIKKLIFSEGSTNVFCKNIDESYGEITEAYKVNYDNRYPEIPKGILIRFEKNQKITNPYESNEFYYSFIKDNVTRIDYTFFDPLNDGSEIYLTFSSKTYASTLNYTTINVHDDFPTNYPINIEKLDTNHLKELLTNYNDLISFLIEYRDNVYRYIRDNELQVAYQEKESEEKLSKSIPKIGMTSSEVEKTSWGKPDRINKDTYSWGVHEQWVYDNKGYVYIENGKVTSVSER